MLKWLTATIVVVSVISVCLIRKKWKDMRMKVEELEKSVKANLDKCAAERQGRIRSQKALRKALLQPKSQVLESVSYPMRPIGVVQSCFTTRNGTPRQPSLVPLARACVLFDRKIVSCASLQGLENYSHCWIIYLFHLNTNLEKVWKDPSRSKFKAKVRVPKLKGGKMGLFATRSPHRPNPIGLTVAKVEGIQDNMMLLSGVDLVNGTPILDVKPYLPYCDSIEGAAVPDWVMADCSLTVDSVNFSAAFSSDLSDCWKVLEKKSLYSSPEEIQKLLKQVLSWDIRSAAQRNKFPSVTADNCAPDMRHAMGEEEEEHDDTDKEKAEDQSNCSEQVAHRDGIYRLYLEGLDVTYKIGPGSNVVVENVKLEKSNNKCKANYTQWKDKICV